MAPTSKHDVAAGTVGGSPPDHPTLSSRSSRRTKWLRALGLIAVLGSVALMIVPVSYKYDGLGFSGRRDCGVPLQALFQPPGEKCGSTAMRRSYMAVTALGMGGALFAFAGVRRGLRLPGLIVLGGSPFVMMFPTHGNLPIEVNHTIYLCGSAIGDLVRRGYSEVTYSAGTHGIAATCGDIALNRLYLTLTIAAAGGALIAVDALVKQRARMALSGDRTVRT